MTIRNIAVGLLALGVCGPLATAKEYINTGHTGYRWENDTIFQGPYKAYAATPYHIVSDYSAVPGYHMPIEKEWKKKNDLSAYPRLTTPNKLHEAIYNMGLDEMVNAIEPDSTLRTGKEWPGVWTRDISYSIILSMAALQPEVSRISLEKKINPRGRIIQDTGSGGAWPVSSDRQIWGIAAFEVYKATGDDDWLRRIYPVVKNSLEDDYAAIYDRETGLVRGETSFIDWREQSYPRWMQTADIYASEAMGTNIVHVQAWRTLAEMAEILGEKADAKEYTRRADALADAVNRYFWMPDKGYYGMYLYGRDFPILNPRAETLGESLAILYDVASADRAVEITQNNPITPFGPAIFYPQIPDQPPYHNNALWPFVAGYWTLANAKAGNDAGTMQGIGSIFRPAALFATNKENFVLDNGDIGTEVNSSNMLWGLAANLAVTNDILFGIHYTTKGIEFRPFVPKALEGTRSLEGLRYRNAVLNITVSGYGSEIKSFTLNGKEQATPFVPATIKGENNIVITMADNSPVTDRVNNVANAKAPLTPIAWLTHDPSIAGETILNLLEWNPIEYIDRYIVLRNGKPVAETRETRFPATEQGEYQVIGVDGQGVQSFASQPRSNAPVLTAEFLPASTTFASREAQAKPAEPLKGYTGEGFVEVDRHTAPVALDIDVDEPGTYGIALRYANGNGPVNTENKCAIRTIFVDGQPAGTVVMPHRGVGNWNDWGLTNSLQVPLTAGRHTIEVRFLPQNENMNIGINHALIDRVQVTKL